MNFPKPINPPDSVFKARSERGKHIFKATLIGVALRSIIIIVEFFGAFFFGSAALFMDALSSTLDVIASCFLILFIKLAERPPDANHPFGHGRFEPLAGLQLGLLLFIVGIGMFIQQAFQLNVESSKERIEGFVWIIPLGAVILLELCYAISTHAAKKHESPALQADAAHYRIDSLTSLFAAVALIFAAYFPHLGHALDHIGAMAIAIFMIVMGSYTIKGNLNQLMDYIPPEKYFKMVKEAAKDVPGVLDTEKTRIQMYGPDAHVDIDVEVDPDLSVEKAHCISQEVRTAIQQKWPQVRDVTVHIEPYYPGDH